MSTDTENEPVLEEKPAVTGPSTVEWRRRKAGQVAKAREQRTFSSGEVEVRSMDDGSLTLHGYACLTGVSYDMGWHQETVAPGAFRRSLSESPDVQLLVNHGAGGGIPLARTKSGTLNLEEDSKGLRVEASLDPEDPEVQRLARVMARGDMDQMSFAFQATSDTWNEDYSDRVLKAVSIHRGDVSVVNQGASPTTFATIRSLAVDRLLELGDDAFVAALVEWRDHTLLPLEQRVSKTLSAASMDVLTQVLQLVSSADDAMDEAQPLLAALMGVPNPDADDEPDADDGMGGGMGGMGRAAEPPEIPERTRVVAPDYAMQARLQRMARSAR